MTKALKSFSVGHRGSGKTTELHNLQYDLENEGYFVVFVSALDDLNLSDLYYTDIFLLLIRRTIETIRDKSMRLRSEILDELESLLEQVGGESEIAITKEKKTGVKLGAAIERLLRIVGSRDYTSREIIRKKSHTQIIEIIGVFNQIISSVEDATDKKMIIIIDDLEKVTEYKKIREILVDQSIFFEKLNCCIVITIPPSLVYSPEFLPARITYGNTQFLPLFQVRNKNGSINSGKTLILENIVRKRISDEFDPCRNCSR